MLKATSNTDNISENTKINQRELLIGNLSTIYKAAGDTLRLQMLRIMRRNSFSVMEICYLFDVSQPAASHHLKILAQADLLTARKEGNNVFIDALTPTMILVCVK